MYGVIDIGSNTIRLSVYKINEDQSIKSVFNKKVVAGLGREIDENGAMTQEGQDITIETLVEFKKIIDSMEIKQVFPFATASFRNIVNTEEVISRIHSKSGIQINVISGNQEAVYDFIGAGSGLDLRDGILVDIGGGSTELVFYKNGEIIETVSFPIGSLNMYTKYVSKILPTKDEINKIKKEMIKYLARLDMSEFNGSNVCGIGGSIRGTLKINNDIQKTMKNRRIKGSDVEEILKLYERTQKKSMKRITQILPGRIHTIIPGICILDAIITYYQCDTITVSRYGVREGYLIWNLSEQEKILSNA